MSHWDPATGSGGTTETQGTGRDDLLLGNNSNIMEQVSFILIEESKMTSKQQQVFVKYTFTVSSGTL